MAAPILVCSCGVKMRAPGATPGRVGRCPQCGAMLRVPEVSAAAAEPAPQPRKPRPAPAGPAGYRLAEPERPRRRAREGAEVEAAAAADDVHVVNPARAGVAAVVSRAPLADGLLPPLDAPEGRWLVSAVYPLRAAECLGLIAIMATVFWVFTILVPEYCLSLQEDADSMGATLMGHLVTIVTALPAVFLGLPALFYWLQYLGRVLVSSAMGDTTPPRPPDRNFDGFLNGLRPWFVWLLLGGSVAALPLALQRMAAGPSAPWSLPATAALVLLGLPYGLMALMLCFLHDHPLAATPAGVLGGIARLGGGFGRACAGVVLALGAILGAFLLLLVVRGHAFWVYLAIAWAWWAFALWMSTVALRLLGLAYYHQRGALNWHHERPRWGVTWGL